MYTFFLSIVIYGEGAITNEIGKYLTFLVAVFFAVDRILSVWKDVKEVAKEYYPLYYHYVDDISTNELFGDLIDVQMLSHVNEEILAKQIFIRKRIGLNQDSLDCKNLYIQKGFNKYLEYM